MARIGRPNLWKCEKSLRIARQAGASAGKKGSPSGSKWLASIDVAKRLLAIMLWLEAAVGTATGVRQSAI